MYTVSNIKELNTPESLGAIARLYGDKRQPKLLNFVFVERPYSMGAQGRAGSILVRDELGHIWCSAYLAPFTSNCGIQALSNIRVSATHLGKLFMSLIDSYLIACKYSVVVGSDGNSSGNASLFHIKNYGHGWVEVPVGPNRRMQEGNSNTYTMTLFYKVLDWALNEHPEIDWARAVETS